MRGRSSSTECRERYGQGLERLFERRDEFTYKRAGEA